MEWPSLHRRDPVGRHLPLRHLVILQPIHPQFLVDVVLGHLIPVLKTNQAMYIPQSRYSLLPAACQWFIQLILVCIVIREHIPSHNYFTNWLISQSIVGIYQNFLVIVISNLLTDDLTSRWICSSQPLTSSAQSCSRTSCLSLITTTLSLSFSLYLFSLNIGVWAQDIWFIYRALSYDR